MSALLPEIQNRSSALLYDENRVIEPDKLSAILEAARLAPSAKNTQPWRYILVQDKDQRDGLIKALHPANFWAGSAPCLIVQLTKPDLGYQGNDKPYYLYDCGLSVMSLVVEAEHQGLKCRQIAAFDEDAVKQVLQIPSDWQVVIIVAGGYVGDLEREKPHLLQRWGKEAFSRIESRILNSQTRKAMEEIVCFGRYTFE